MIHLRNEKEIDAIRECCQIVAGALNYVKTILSPGLSSIELDREIESFILKHNGRPAFKGYQGFPASSCISINDQVVHGIPDKTVFEKGNIVKVDIGVEKNGYFGDAAKTFAIEELAEESSRLLKVTRESLYEGIAKAQHGSRLSDISHAIQTHVEKAGFSIVRQLVGHGIGTQLHEDPQVPNYGRPGKGPRLREGIVLAIEPMVNCGGHKVVTDDDGWTIRSADGSLSAHFEHTIVIRKNGTEVLTQGI